MSNSPDIDWLPTLPEDQKGRELYFDRELSSAQLSALTKKGWVPVNILTQPRESEKDAIRNIKCLLEGIRLGTIEADQSKWKYIELECKIYGISFNQKRQLDETDKPKEGLEALKALFD